MWTPCAPSWTRCCAPVAQGRHLRRRHGAGVHHAAREARAGPGQRRSQPPQGRVHLDRAHLPGDPAPSATRRRRASWPRPASPRSASTTPSRRSAAGSASPIRSAESRYRTLEKYSRDLTRAGQERQARSGDRPRQRDPARDPGALAPHQEQPGADRRSRRGQDRHRRGPGAEDRRQRRAGNPDGQARGGAGPGRDGGRIALPRRVRGAPEGGDGRDSARARARSSCSSTSCTRSSARARPRARWTPAT